MREEISVAVEGLNFLPLDIFGLIDCLIDRICWSFSGPDGDYVGAPRKEQYACTQWEFYTSYKTCHGIKVETVLCQMELALYMALSLPASTTQQVF
jgi:hypothetical protein